MCSGLWPTGVLLSAHDRTTAGRAPGAPSRSTSNNLGSSFWLPQHCTLCVLGGAPSVLSHYRADAMPCCAVLCVLGSLLLRHGADRFAADDLELKPEPTLESFGIKTSKGAAANQQQQQSQQQEEEGSAAAGLAGNGAAPGSEDEPGGWRACSAALISTAYAACM